MINRSNRRVSCDSRLFKNNHERREVRLHLKIDQKTDAVLKLIHEVFGGYIGYRKSQGTFYYQSTGFNHALKVTKYFDNYHLLSLK